MRLKYAVLLAAIFALALPAGAFATDGDHDGDHADKGDVRHHGDSRDCPDKDDDGDTRVAASRDGKHDDSHGDRHKGARPHHKSKSRSHRFGHHKRGIWFKPFAVFGTTTATELPVDDNGNLTGPVTLDPSHANWKSRKYLGVTQEQVDGTDTVSFGVAGDSVKVFHIGRTEDEAIQPTDRIRVLGKFKNGALDVRWIVVKRHS